MSGIDKILQQIHNQAKSDSDIVIAKAQEQAQEIISNAKKQACIQSLQLQKENDIACSNIIERANSTAVLVKRQAMLKAKQSIISQAIDNAHKKLLSLDDKEYFSVIVKMIEKYSTEHKGKIMFNKKDINRMPLLFTAKIEIASGNTLKLSSETVDIDGGFIISYGNIEENCSFKALFEGNQEMLQDKVSNLLFS